MQPPGFGLLVLLLEDYSPKNQTRNPRHILEMELRAEYVLMLLS